MPLSAVSSKPLAHKAEQDVNLSQAGLDHKLAAQIPAGTNGHGGPAPLDASKLVYQRTTSPRPVPDELTACAGEESICTDHMITCEWTFEHGWDVPELKPYGPLSLMPTASCLHYATECFEGLKAYRGHDGALRLFRPDCNARRMLQSALRISLPGFDPAALERLVLALMAIDGPRWLPRSRPGSYLYLRPALIGTHAQLGVQEPKRALLFITASFMPRLDAPVGGMRLHTSPDDMVRAWVGGFGYAKLGANYGPSLLATAEARARGYGQILWLYGPEGYCTEAGASNFFLVMRSATSGRPELVTAPLDDRLILDGVTRRTVIQMAKERLSDELHVLERRYTIAEVVEAASEGRILEAFAAGTAFFICPVSLIHHRGEDISIPMAQTKSGEYTAKLKGWIGDIMYGNEQHPWGVVVDEEE